MTSETPLEILVIGAGISGLAFASVYLDIHPTADLLILEKEEIPGGTWNRRRLYSHFWTQWAVEFGEFSDKPMRVPPPEDQYYGFFKSKHTTNYLEEYATSQVIGGRSLQDRIRFSSLVVNVRKEVAGWVVETADTYTSEHFKFVTRRLVIASGITSIPRIPQLKGSETFGGTIIHNLDFGSAKVLTDPDVKHITVLGGGKSGADMVYACVKAGKAAAWIVSPSGTGPPTFVTPKGKGPFKSAFELASTRVSEAVQPSYLESKNMWTNFLHRSSPGLALSRKIWAAMDAEILAEANYANRPSRKGFEMLVPHTSVFWQNNAVGLLNHTDFYEVVAKSVDIYYDGLESLKPREISLKSGESFQSDALLLGTGWRNSLDYMSPSLRADLGLPYPLTADLNSDQLSVSRQWSQREQSADADIAAAFPALANPPKHVRAPAHESPFRLYNLVVPTNDDTRSLACVGQISTTNYFRTGEMQSLWVTAYFDGNLTLPPLDERQDDVAHFVAWNRRRYLSLGNGGNTVVFDTFRYTDRLLQDLGLKSHLKGPFANVFSPNRAKDYAKLREEYIKRYSRDMPETREPSQK